MKRKSQQQWILELYVLHLGMHAHEVSCTKQDIKFLAYEPEGQQQSFLSSVTLGYGTEHDIPIVYEPEKSATAVFEQCYTWVWNRTRHSYSV